ncbi:MAG: hypothetical protein PHN43_02630 [Patescibacteria group bacterium]|nr:hypothetical protein [Patescibacteria group bacterium]MDD3434992.1 hypothetical protein [Patescibacteria group bacterium]
MRNPKKTGLIIIISAFILLVALIFFILWQKNYEPVEPEIIIPAPTSTLPLAEADPVEAPQTTPSDRPRNYQAYDISQEAAYQVSVYDAEKRAQLFAERFGSFSNQSNYNNIADVTILMTPSMRLWAENYLAELRQQPYDGDYYGIISNVVFTEILNYNEAEESISFAVTTERQETKGLDSSEPYRQVIDIDLIKDGNDWLVDRAQWR